MDRKYRRSPRSSLLLPRKQCSPDAEAEFYKGGGGFEVDGASFPGAVFNLSTTIVGAGIMALPETLKQLGTIPGLLFIILAVMLTEKSIDIILRFSRAAKTASYSGLACDAFGGAGGTLLQVCIVINYHI